MEQVGCKCGSRTFQPVGKVTFYRDSGTGEVEWRFLDRATFVCSECNLPATPGVLAKDHIREDTRLIRAAPELLRGARWLLAALEGGDGDACGAAERHLRRAVREATPGPPRRKAH